MAETEDDPLKCKDCGIRVVSVEALKMKDRCLDKQCPLNRKEGVPAHE